MQVLTKLEDKISRWLAREFPFAKAENEQGHVGLILPSRVANCSDQTGDGVHLRLNMHRKPKLPQG
jgi:hypothetical protein